MGNLKDKNGSEDFIAGGFSGISIDSKTCIDAFNFLKNEFLEKYPGLVLIQVLNAEEQVVAGYNVGLICEYKKSNDDKINKLYAKIYVDLQENYELDMIEFEEEKFPEGI